MTPSVVITGLGVVSPLGVGARGTLEAVARGERAAAPLSAFDAAGFEQPRGGEVRDFHPRDYFKAPKSLKLTDRTTQFAVAAATLALGDAGWTDAAGPGEQLGVVLGCSGSDLRVAEVARALGALQPDQVDDIRVFGTHILNGLNPLWLLINLPNMSSAHVAIQLEARGPNSTVMSDSAAGVQAIGEAFEWIRAAEADAVLAGGADTGLTPLAYAAFEQAGLFDGAEPYLPAEGAAILLLESEEHARSRGAPIRGEVLGYASAAASADDLDAIAEKMAATFCQAASQAGWDAIDIGTVALAVGGRSLADAPRLALARAFGDRSPLFRSVSFEPWLGHALAAAAPIDLALALASRAVSRDPPGILCGAVGLSGHMAAIAVRVGDAALSAHER